MARWYAQSKILSPAAQPLHSYALLRVVSHSFHFRSLALARTANAPFGIEQAEPL